MIAVFLGFVLGDDPATKMFGLGLATAIFVDATIVRLVLVPATMTLLGDANWWLPAGSTGCSQDEPSDPAPETASPAIRDVGAYVSDRLDGRGDPRPEQSVHRLTSPPCGPQLWLQTWQKENDQVGALPRSSARGEGQDLLHPQL